MTNAATPAGSRIESTNNVWFLPVLIGEGVDAFVGKGVKMLAKEGVMVFTGVVANAAGPTPTLLLVK